MGFRLSRRSARVPDVGQGDICLGDLADGVPPFRGEVSKRSLKGPSVPVPSPFPARSKVSPQCSCEGQVSGNESGPLVGSSRPQAGARGRQLQGKPKGGTAHELGGKARIGFPNTPFFLSRGAPITALDACVLDSEGGAGLLSLDSTAEHRLSRAACGLSLVAARCHRSREPSDAAESNGPRGRVAWTVGVRQREAACCAWPRADARGGARLL